MLRGEYFGELGILENKERSASVYAIEDSYLVRIDSEDWKTLFENEMKLKLRRKVEFFESTIFS
jgi:CRP-like cAMP-binding protein